VSKIKEKSKKYEERLMAAFAFDEDDLEANEAGQLSQNQIIRLKSLRNKTLTDLMILSLLCIVAVGILMGVTVTISATIPAFIVGIFAIGTLFIIYNLKARRLLADIHENCVAQAEGRVDLSLKAKQNDPKYFIHIDNMHFSLKESLFLLFKNGDPYRIYYAPRSKRILSVEWLRDSDDNLLSQTQRMQIRASTPSQAAVNKPLASGSDSNR